MVRVWAAGKDPRGFEAGTNRAGINHIARQHAIAVHEHGGCRELVVGRFREPGIEPPEIGALIEHMAIVGHGVFPSPQVPKGAREIAPGHVGPRAFAVGFFDGFEGAQGVAVFALAVQRPGMADDRKRLEDGIRFFGGFVCGSGICPAPLSLGPCPLQIVCFPGKCATQYCQ